MERFFLIIFWIILFFYAFRLIFRYVFPWLLARWINKMSNQMGQKQNTRTGPQNEGEVKIRSHGEDAPKVDPDFGEYVDFEDVKDPKQPL